MTLANDIYTILNAGWDGAVITKPTSFLTNQIKASETVKTRQLIINSEEAGSFEPVTADGSDDMRVQSFFIIGAEGSESDCGKCIAQVKKNLKRSSSTANGTYRILTYRIIRDLQICKYFLTGSINKLVEDDAF